MKKLKRFFVLILTLVALFYFAKAIRFLTVEKDVKTITTAHFVVTYKNVYKSNAEAVAETLEREYGRITSDLGNPKHDVIAVFLHGDRDGFTKATGLTNNANGTSRGPKEFHVFWTNWFNSIFPDDATQTALHEFTHCVQLNILIQQALAEHPAHDAETFNARFEEKFSTDYPRWFWESVSIYQAGEVNGVTVGYAFRSRPSLSSLNEGNEIYLLGYTIQEYIVKTWGKEKIPELIRAYGDVEKVLGVSPEAFEKQWHAFVEKNY